jgi:4-amino-4-deoxy-L-arabinose transferase-like glycosyltransferase
LDDRAKGNTETSQSRPAAIEQVPGAQSAGRVVPGLRWTAAGWFWLALAFTALLALVLRAYDLAHNPPELFEDELAGAASAWSIVTTGHDVGRTVLPFLTTRLELKQPLYGFATVPFQWLLGHETLAVRLPAVLFGGATVLLTAWLARCLGRSRVEQVTAAVLMAILPWAVHLGRIGWEPASALPFTIAGAGLLWTGLESGKRPRVVAAAIVLAIGAYTYQPALVINILLAAWTLVARAPHIRRSDLAGISIGALAALLVLVPYGLAARDPLFLQRAAAISTFAHGLNAQDVGLAWTNYWAQWNPRWLFLEGTANLRNEPDMGVVFPWVAPFLALGVLRLLKRRAAGDVLLLGWLVLGPVPAALTNDGVPHFLRGVAALPPLVVTSSVGLAYAWQLAGRLPRASIVTPTLAAVVVAIALQETMSAALFYYRDYPAASASAWYYGTGEALTLAREDIPAGARLCIETPSVSYWTFPQYVAWYLGNVPFAVTEGTSDPKCASSGAYLLVHMDTDVPAASTIITTVPNYDGSPLFKLVRVGSSG